MLSLEQLKNTLEACSSEILNILSSGQSKGIEKSVQLALLNVLGEEARSEIPLQDIGTEQVWAGTQGRLDVLIGTHGFELKVIRLPRLDAVPSKALYDIGQLSGDYWRIKNAKKLTSGELVVLLHGSLVNDLEKPTAILREFHNRMFVDYKTSLKFGELAEEKNNPNRVRQIDAIRSMGFDKPYCDKGNRKIVTFNGLALVSITVQ